MAPNENPASQNTVVASPRPKVSVYMPVYNAEEYVGRAIESILDQTLGDFEFLIVDDGSTDGSVGVVERYRDPRIRLIRQENQGCYPARNAALRVARGEYLANMDADDISLPERLEKQAAFLDQHPEVVLVGTRTYECDKDDTVRLPRPDFFKADEGSEVPGLVPLGGIAEKTPFVPGTMMFRSSILSQMAPYDPRLHYCGDWDFIWRASLLGRVGCLPDILYVIRLLPSSISSMGGGVQARITKIIAGRITSYTDGKIPDFPESAVEELKTLRNQQRKLGPKRSEGGTLYHGRMATLYRVNGHFLLALKETMRGFANSPMQAVLSRRYHANIIKSSLGLLKQWLGLLSN